MWIRAIVRALIGLGLVTVGVALAQHRPPNPPAPTHKTIQQGDQYRKAGDVKKGLDEYEKARQLPVDPAVKHEAALKAGESRVLLSRTEKNKQVYVNGAIKDFQQVINSGTPTQKARAQNNLAAVYINNGEPHKAIESLKKTDWNQIDKTQHYVLHYNLGRAYDKTGEPLLAIKEYHNALKTNPHFTRAAQKAVETVRASKTTEVLFETSRLGRTLVEQGHPEEAKQVALAVLQNKAFDREAEQGLAILLRAYAKTPRTPQQFLQDEEASLQQLAALGYADAAREIRKAYQGSLEIEIQHLYVREVKAFPWFSALRREEVVPKAFSALLNQAGNYYAFDAATNKFRQPDQALARYVLAWMMADNTEAAVNTAWILSAAHQELDRQNVVYDRLVDIMFQEKGRLYTLKYRTKEDWENLLRMHLLLGTIFESKKQWGSEYEPRSAIFQWQWALNAEAEIRKGKSERGYRAAGLHERLAMAYQETKQYSKALDHYLDAGEKYLAEEERAKAEEMLAGAAKLKIQPSDAQKTRLAAIEEDFVNNMSGAREATTSGNADGPPPECR